MKYLSFTTLAALLALSSFSKASAAPIVVLSFGSTVTDQTLEFSKPFSDTLFSPSFLNSVLSATLTSQTPGTSSSATVTADVFLENTAIPLSKVQVANETLTLNLSTTTSTTQTIETSLYPTTFYPGPTGSFDEMIVDVTGSSLVNALVSFTGLAELESVPEPSTWAMLLGGMGVMLVAARFRRTAVRS